MRSLAIDVVTDDRALHALADDWDALARVTPRWSAFQSFAWVAACRAALPASARLFVIVVRDGTDVVGILPTELGPRHDLRFIGEAVSNYLGPVHRPGRHDQLVDALAGFLESRASGVDLLDLRGLREGSPFSAALARAVLPRWSDPHSVETAICPYIDLAGGWAAVYGRRKGSSRAQLSRKWRGLARLGQLEYREATDAEGVAAALPALFDIFTTRWTGRHESGGFATRFREFHLRSAPALAAAGLVRLSLLTLDGETIAFTYGVRTESGTSSYVIGHRPLLNPHSPGSLVLMRTVEAACHRGDPEYDFAVGVEGFKDEWATGRRRVSRLVRWRTALRARLSGSARVLGTRAWVSARAVGPLRTLKREGIRRALLGPPPVASAPDTPGLAAGAVSSWTVARIPGAARDPRVELRRWRYGEMAGTCSPRLLQLAVDRNARGDVLLAVHVDERLIGIVWRASPARAALVSGGYEPTPATPLYYHPVPASRGGVDALLDALAAADGSRAGFVLVSGDGARHADPAAVIGTFKADLRFAGGRTAEPERMQRAGSDAS